MVAIQRASITDTEAMKELLSVPTSASGETVSIDTLVGLDAFKGAVELVSNRVSMADIFHLKKLPEGGRKIDENHPAFDLLTRKANLFQSSREMIELLVSNAIWAGNSYCYIEKIDNTPIALHPIDPRNVYPVQEFTDGRLTNLYYGVQTDRKQQVVFANEMIHIKNVSMMTGLEGISLVDKMKTTLGLSLAVQKWGAVYFKNGSHLGPKILKIPGWLDREKQEELKASLGQAHQGLDNAHKLAVLMGGSELTSMPVSNEEAQWLESRRMTLNTVALAVGCPGTKLGDRGAISYGSLQQDNEMFYSDFLSKWLSKIETEFSIKLLKSNERKKIIAFDRDSLRKNDEHYVESLEKQFNSGQLSWEEMREKQNRTTDIEGLTFQKVPCQEPEPAPVIEPPQEEPQETLEEKPQETDAPQEPPQETTDTTLERAKRLTDASLGRIKKRIIRSIENDPDLTKHFHTIRETLPDDSEIVIEEIKQYQDELNEVLPEQRIGVIEQWQTKELASKIWK